MMNMKSMTLEKARKLKGFRESTMTPQCPLRYRPAIVPNENGDGYYVVELGFVIKHELIEVK